VAETESVPVIENEIPAYRAISALALASLGLGLLSALSFANFTFLVAAGLAVMLGVYADYRIRRVPDVLTGRGFAQAGVALGLIFGLSSLTSFYVNMALMRREAVAFGERYARDVEAGGAGQAVLYMFPPAQRRRKTPEEALDQLNKSGNGPNGQSMARSHMPGMFLLTDRLKIKGTTLRYSAIEAVGYDGLKPVASVRLTVRDPQSTDDSPKEYAMLLMEGEPAGRGAQWRVQEVLFPYKPNTYTPPVKAVDDGHGHGH
jgi:hypothetical protein